MTPKRPNFEEAVQELLQAGALSNCPMCARNTERRWKYIGKEEAADPDIPLRLICGNCHYIVEFDIAQIYAGIRQRKRK